MFFNDGKKGFPASRIIAWRLDCDFGLELTVDSNKEIPTYYWYRPGLHASPGSCSGLS